MYNLFLDDVRVPVDVTWIELPLVEWVIVRSYDHFCEYIKSNGLPKRISFDHDLADEHYNHYIATRGKGDPALAQFKEKTGYDCVKWLVQYCMDHNQPFPESYFHTMNPIGKENMEKYIQQYNRVYQT